VRKSGDKKGFTDHVVRKGDAEMYFTGQGVRKMATKEF
jgi:hypothetical protein